jgi:hypothetical protein
MAFGDFRQQRVRRAFLIESCLQKRHVAFKAEYVDEQSFSGFSDTKRLANVTQGKMDDDREVRNPWRLCCF